MPCYWASYGRSGFLGSFAGQSNYSRGEAVVVQSPRGLEAASILEEVDERFAPSQESDGEILRTALSEDLANPGTDYLNAAVAAAESLPVLVADAELLLDGLTLILHVMPWDDVDLTDWAKELSQRFKLDVRLLNLAELTPEKLAPKGCGKPGCGEKAGGCGDCGTGGCSSGSCSKGSVKSAAELTAYFLNLRQQMETRRTSLV